MDTVEHSFSLVGESHVYAWCQHEEEVEAVAVLRHALRVWSGGRPIPTCQGVLVYHQHSDPTELEEEVAYWE